MAAGLEYHRAGFEFKRAGLEYQRAGLEYKRARLVYQRAGSELRALPVWVVRWCLVDIDDFV